MNRLQEKREEERDEGSGSNGSRRGGANAMNMGAVVKGSNALVPSAINLILNCKHWRLKSAVCFSLSVDFLHDDF